MLRKLFISALCIASFASAAKLSMQEAMHAGDSIVPAEARPIWDSLSLKEKAAQMVMVYLPPASFITQHQFGGVLIMKNHFKDTLKLQNQLATANAGLKIPLLTATDQEGGKVNRLGGVSESYAHLPSARAMREMQEDSLQALAKEIGEGLTRYGINLNLAPVLDPSKDHRGKATFMEVSDRSFGPRETAEPKLRAFAKGMKEAGVICTSKHFPGYDSWTNSDHQIAISATPKDSVVANAAHFGNLADDIPVIMMSSVRYIRYSSKPVVFEPKFVQLARELAPNAILLTDDLWGASLRSWISGKERVVSKGYPTADFRKLIRTVLFAGNDMFMITYPAKAVEMIQYLERIGKQEPAARQKIELAAARIVRLKYENGILKVEEPSTSTAVSQ